MYIYVYLNILDGNFFREAAKFRELLLFLANFSMKKKS